jgi:SAM-dependent methyltransferase
VFQTLDMPNKVDATLVDIDAEAVAFVRERRDAAGFQSQMILHQANLVYLAMGRTSIDLAPQDLIYSIGLIDYFNDRFVVNLMNYAYRLLKPGGRLILGNFHPRNPIALMDYVLDWKLIHRTEEDMDRLFAASMFSRPPQPGFSSKR